MQICTQTCLEVALSFLTEPLMVLYNPFSLAIALWVVSSCHCVLKPKILTKPEDSIQNIRFSTVCLDLGRTGMSKDNGILLNFVISSEVL